MLIHLLSPPATTLARGAGPRRAACAAALLVCLLLTAGCETTPETVPVADPERAFAERQDRIAALEAWTAVGKLAVRSPDDSWSVNVLWRQTGEGYLIRLSGPLGQGIMELDGAPDRVAMRTAENETYEAASADALVLERTGWRLPVGGLRYWILGVPAPTPPVENRVLDAAGRLAHLRQAGWDIQFERYDESEGVDMPTRITLESKPIGAKVVVRTWRLGPGT